MGATRRGGRGLLDGGEGGDLLFVFADNLEFRLLCGWLGVRLSLCGRGLDGRHDDRRVEV